jgi:predicted dienelactone hydrolase
LVFAGGLPEGSVTDKRASKALFKVGSLALVLTDQSRITQTNKEATQKPSRRLEGRAYYPIENGENQPGPAPLIVFSHGFSSSHRGGEYLGRYLAGLGYVVAMVDFPMTHMSADGGPFVKDVVNQPRDVSFLIDQLLSLAMLPEHELHDLIDPERIGVMGVSLGGFTSTLIGFHPTMRDDRVDSVISIAGPTYFLTPRFFENRDLPFMMIGGTYDVLVPFESNAANIQDKDSDAWLVSIERGAHTAFSGPTAAFRFWIT